MHPYDVRLADGVHEGRVTAFEVALPEDVQRRGTMFGKRTSMSLGVVVRQHLGVVDLGLVNGLQRVLVWVLGLELP